MRVNLFTMKYVLYILAMIMTIVAFFKHHYDVLGIIIIVYLLYLYCAVL